VLSEVAIPPPYFFLEKKVTKIQDSKMLPLPHEPTPANQSEPQGCTFGPCFAHAGPLLQPEANALPAALAHHVLPDFVRKRFAVAEKVSGSAFFQSLPGEGCGCLCSGREGFLRYANLNQ